MKNFIIGLLIIAFIGLVISAMNTNKTELKLSDVKADEVTDSYWSEYSKGYMEGCKEGNATYAYCSCTLSEMESKYGRAKIVEISLKFKEDKILPKELFNAAAVCAGK